MAREAERVMEDRVWAERRLATKPVFDGKLLQVRVDTVSLPDGGQAFREVVEHRPAAVIVPIDRHDNVHLVRQYRYAVGEALLEVPAGVFEESESPEACAQRELQEETGFRSEDLQSLGRFWASPGFTSELMYVYVARDLVPSSLAPDPDENIVTEKVPLSGVAGLIRTGEIRDAKSIAALLMATCLAGQG